MSELNRSAKKMKHAARILVFVLALVVLTSCTLSSHYGAYDGANSPDWVLYEEEGATVYRLPHYRRDDPDVSFYSKESGQLYFRITSLVGAAPAVFHGPKIRVLVQGSAESFEFDAKEICTLTVPKDRDFTIVVPAFDVGSKKLPELNAHFHWSDRTLRVLFRRSAKRDPG